MFTFFFTDPATTKSYTLSLHDALPIWMGPPIGECRRVDGTEKRPNRRAREEQRAGRNQQPDRVLHGIHVIDEPLRDRKSTRLNSSHQIISYAVFCLKKKKKNKKNRSIK